MEPAFLDTFKGRLRLEGVLTTRTGLHIGAGGSGDPLATDAPVVRNAAGEPFIPGASLKGVVRSAAEGLLRGTTSREGATCKLSTCEFLAGKPCVPHFEIEDYRKAFQEELEEKEKKARGDKSEGGKATSSREAQARKARIDYQVQRAVAGKIWEESCTICRLFGSLALASRVRFPDLPLHGGMPMLELRNGVGIDRDRELAASGVLYDFEAVPPGTAFELTVVLDNYSEAEVGLILWLFDQLDQGNLALGGKSSRGLGQVRIRWSHIHETRLNGANPFAQMLSSRDLLAPDHDLLQSEATKEGPKEAGPRLPTTGDAEVWKKLADILQDLPTIDKTFLGQRASELGIKKEELNDTLSLGLEGKRARQKAWDTVLDRFVECGLLIEKKGTYILAGDEEAEEKDTTGQAAGERDPRLQEVYDRFAGAMARLWQEAF